MGLLGWLAGRYYVKSAQRIVEDARSLPLHMRKAVVTHLVERMHLTTESERLGVSALAVTVLQVFQQATHERQMAVAHGASSRTDPTWCSAAIVETWAGARLGAMQGRISKRRFDQVDAMMYNLITDTFSPQELGNLIARRPS